MKARNILLLLIILLTSSQCKEKSGLSEAEKQSIAKEIQLYANDYGDALRRKDLKWFQQFWANTNEFVFAGDGRVVTDYNSEITGKMKRIFADVKEIPVFEFSNGHVYVLSKDAASYATDFTWTVVSYKGDTTRCKGAWLYVFQKSADGWRVVQSAGTHKYY